MGLFQYTCGGCGVQLRTREPNSVGVVCAACAEKGITTKWDEQKGCHVVASIDLQAITVPNPTDGVIG